jgi:hypothetical protein
MIRWLREVLEPEWLVAVAILYLGSVAVTTLILAFFPEAPVGFDGCIVVPMFAVAAYGYYRIAGFHPAMRPEYHNWLAATPWTPSKPLPLGPVHLAPQDFLNLGAIILLAWPVNIAASLSAVPIFVFMYLMIFGWALFRSQEVVAWYFVSFACALMLYLMGTISFVSRPVAIIAMIGSGVVALIAYAVAYIAYRKSLQRFPWHADTNEERRRQLGWPFRAMAPRFIDYIRRDRVPFGHAIAISFLAGSWFWVMFGRINEAGFGAFYTGFVFLTAFVRASLYFGGIGGVCRYLPPIDLWTRIRTGRLIIPAYDVIFVAPVVALAAGLDLPFALARLGVPRNIGDTLGGTLVLFIVLAFGPDLKEWRLTGNHRISAQSGRQSDHSAVG